MIKILVAYCAKWRVQEMQHACYRCIQTARSAVESRMYKPSGREDPGT